MISRRCVLVLPAAARLAADDDGVPLFDGSSPAGWVSVTGEPFPPRSWTIVGGCLKANAHASGGFQDIRTVAEFESFDLTFEWKLEPGGNSGVKYSLQRADSWKPKDDPGGATGPHARARGLEFQLADGQTPDARRGAQYSAGALYGLYAPRTTAPVRPGKFNTARILFTAARLAHWINGELLVEADPGSAEFAARIKASKDERLLTRPRRSPVALQNHGSEAWFRNLRIRRVMEV